MKKILLIIIDGLGDEPIPRLKNKTPLEAAKTPNLDFLAKNGICGQVLPYFERGENPTSEETHLALFGYGPRKFNPGRGVLEVLGLKEKILPGDLCLRGNFTTVNKDLKIIDRRAGRIEKTQNLILALEKIKIRGVRIIIKKGLSHRLGIIFRGKNFSENISSNDSKKAGVKVLKIFPKDNSKKAKFTAKILNEFVEKSHLILKNYPFNKNRKLPANYLLLRGAGKFKRVKSFFQKFKLKSACIAGAPLYKGIGKYLGMDLIEIKGANGLPNTNLRGKIFSARQALGKYEFIFLHIKAADNLAEDGKFFEKMKFIEKIDKNLKPILNLKNSLIVVTGDHSTCSLLKRHCKRPLPILIYGNGKDGVLKFSEKNCRKGKLKIKQIGLMKKTLELAKS